MLPHLSNPEVNASSVTAVIYYLGFGAFLALISLKDRTIKLAIGIHAANNRFITLVVSFAGSAFGDLPSLFYTNQFDPLSDLVTFLGTCALFYVVIFVVFKRW